MAVSIILLFTTIYLIISWSGEELLLWLMVGVTAVCATVAFYVSDYLSRFRVGRSYPTAELRTRWIERCERDLVFILLRAPVVLLVVGLVARIEIVPLQVGFDALLWNGVILCLVGELRRRRTLRRLDR